MPLNRLADHVPGVLYQFIMYPDGRMAFPYASGGMRDIYGVSPEEVVADASKVLALLHPDDLPRVRESILASARTLELWRAEYRVCCPGQPVRWVSGESTPQRLDDGTTLWHGYIFDITARKQQETELAEMQTSFRLTMEASNTGLWRWDLQTNEVSWSDEAYSQLGYAPQSFSMTLEVFRSLMHPDDAPEAFSRVGPLKHVNHSFQAGFRLKNAAGDWTWLESRGKVTAYDDEQRPLVMMGTHVPIDSTIEAQHAVEQARQEAEMANQAKSLFLAHLSHEIRTPLSGLIGLSQMGLQATEVTALHQTLRQINQSARHLLTLLNNVLDMSKIDAQKLDIASRPFSPSNVVNAVVGLFKPLADDKGLTLKAFADEVALNVYEGDDLRLRQVLQNLLSNALKFTAHGGVELHVDIERRQGDTEWLKFSVSDTGIGVAGDQHDRLFKAFIQADSTISRDYGGSGLGLAISQRLVRAMGGDNIHVDSRPGEGATFSFVLPFRRGQLPLPEPVDTALAPVQAPVLSGRVLLIEDDPISQEIESAQLAQFGLSVVCAASGPEALTLIDTQVFDAVILDIGLPHIDGFAVARSMRARGLSVPVIALTAASMQSDRARSVTAGFDAYLVKPVEPADLHDTLARWLGHGAVGPARSSEPAAASLLRDDCTDYLHAQTAISRLMGNATLYRKLLAQFLAQLDRHYGRLAATLRGLDAKSTAAEFVVAQSLVHSLKGVAGNLALEELAALAGDIDRHLKQRKVPAPTLIDTFETLRLQLSDQITTYLADPDKPADGRSLNAGPIDTRPLAARLQALSVAIASSQFISEETLVDIAACLPTSLRQTFWPPLESALDGLDFDAAAEALAALRSELEAG
ncbi:PAS domain-containing hybrid sensor histidine kinase/response regulator [Pusillimonas minor]|uniref:Virulence sensor protein BvgS n=1 Tax=Pusillimonas minor TaxID=2697024 RepID=A0A842HQZ7_9BURK|nr:PAS domain-containing hybrid sensor histidine kinase/response regulator [Pusillimonas minor]MBC2770264.1 PAS domain-containing protein [Pusillimonas minor]